MALPRQPGGHFTWLLQPVSVWPGLGKQSCPGSVVSPKSAAQSLAAPSHGGEGEEEERARWGGGARGNKTGQEAQAGGGHSGPGTNSQHRKPQPTPAHPTRPKLRERGVPKAWYPNRSKGQGLAQGKGGARSTQVLSLPQTLPGEGERKPGWQGWCCLFKSTEILS